MGRTARSPAADRASSARRRTSGECLDGQPVRRHEPGARLAPLRLLRRAPLAADVLHDKQRRDPARRLRRDRRLRSHVSARRWRRPRVLRAVRTSRVTDSSTRPTPSSSTPMHSRSGRSGTSSTRTGARPTGSIGARPQVGSRSSSRRRSTPAFLRRRSHSALRRPLRATALVAFSQAAIASGFVRESLAHRHEGGREAAE